MACQCGAIAIAQGLPEGTYRTCDCGPEGSGTCECGAGAPYPSDREHSLERVVMELDKRLRRLEAMR